MKSLINLLLSVSTGLIAISLGSLANAANSATAAASNKTTFYHGAAYYPELWPEEDVGRDIAEMKKLGINVVRIGEFAWSKIEPNEGEISLDFFLRVMDKLHAAGIGVVFCTPTATPPIWLTDGHPERLYVNANDEALIHGSRQHASYDHHPTP